MKDFNLIVALSSNGVIGDYKTNDLLWSLPTDLNHFKTITSGKTVVMGSRTWESLPPKFRPLPNRRNVVISRSLIPFEGVHAQYTSFKQAYEQEQEGFFVMGGGVLYEEALGNYPKHIYATVIDKEFDGDVMFPLEGNDFKKDRLSLDCYDYFCTQRLQWIRENDLDFQFTVFSRM